MDCRTFLLASFLCCLIAEGALAQVVPEEAGADSLINAFFPVVSYTSNEGFIAGAIYNRYDYRGNVTPFHNYFESSALVSTKGFIEVEGQYERTRTFGENIRSRFKFFFRRYTYDNFFGIGNSTTFDKGLWEEDYYFFQSVGFGISYQARKPLYMAERRRFDLTGGLGSEYHIPYSNNAQTAFAEQTPNGNGGGWINFLSTGFVWENRDSEFDPTQGNRAEFQLRFSPDLISKYDLTTAELELRQYFQLFNRLTVANRMEARHAGGDVPYWEMSKLGDSYTLRGYPLNRFHGKSSLAYTLELRAWIIEFPQYYGLKFGGQLFTDTGRVFTSEDDFADLFRGYKQTYGFGGAMSVFSPDLILRGSIGFSEDLARIYIGVGYMF